MCGITGTAGFGDTALIHTMTNTLVHRGPTGVGYFVDDGVCLGNRRLGILDVERGAQPMANEDGSVVVVYNGEIYNYPELRDQVLQRGHRLSTTCDTEVLPHLYEDEGIDFVRHLNGIFAFALYDRRLRKLFIVRDPIGVKPVVYAARGGKLAFGSEAKAVLASGLVAAEVDEASLHLSMNVRYVPGDRTLFRGIRRLAPGHILEFHDGRVRDYAYTSIDWTPDETLTRTDWTDGIASNYEAAIKRQIHSDVPIGVSLSGGVDSSSIVAMLRRMSSGPIKTFTLGFDEPWDELEDARFVSEKYETEHHETVLRQPLQYLADAIWHTEEPKVNSLQLYLLHRFVSEHVVVLLSGLGGDELFAGYDLYGHLARAQRVDSSPLGAALRAIGPVLDSSARGLATLGRPRFDLSVRKLEFLAASNDRARQYLLLRNAWDFNRQRLRQVYSPDFAERVTTATREEFDPFFDGDASFDAQVMQAEFSTVMLSDLLHNTDTTSMAHSVESRVPLLDLDFVRFAARIPDRFRFGNGMKGLLKDSLRGVLPNRVLDKKKWGFTFDPVEQFKKDLGPMARELLTPERVRRSGVFNPKFVERVVAAEPHQRLRWHYFMLWQMMGYELWHEMFVETGSLISRAGDLAPPLLK